MSNVIYLTGAPATGKSTLTAGMQAAIPELEVFAYSQVLRTYIAHRLAQEHLSEDEIRAKSADIVSREDVKAVDELLMNRVANVRDLKPIVIDSHAVTKESFGFRVTPFELADLRQLNPDVILCLYLDSKAIAERISSNPMGRPMPSLFELDMHCFVQSTLAVQYGVALGKPTYLVDSSIAKDELVRVVLQRCKLSKTS